MLPVVYQQGSLGASGDLAPLAHLSLPLIGKGEVDWQGERWAGSDLPQQAALEPLTLQAKEGLALLNGTQFMSAYACWALLQSQELFHISDRTAALSLDAFNCKMEPFHSKLHNLRPHNGQATTAANIRDHLEGSELQQQPKEALQDPYSFRCTPQVHGASRDAFDHVKQVVETEINAVTDNPNLLPDDDLVLSGGNFHGQPLALTLDYLSMAMAEIGNISERRTYKLLNGNRGLPPFLIRNPGLNSGLMIPQYTAASLVSQNKQLCTPSSVDSITSSNGQEDHVSMGANSATKCYTVIDNVLTILAVEWLVANQALDFRRPKQTSPSLEIAVASFRERVPFNDQDRVMYEDMHATVNFLQSAAIK
jgi:histidine ammonia-lyase